MFAVFIVIIIIPPSHMPSALSILIVFVFILILYKLRSSSSATQMGGFEREGELEPEIVAHVCLPPVAEGFRVLLIYLFPLEHVPLGVSLSTQYCAWSLVSAALLFVE